MLYTSEHWRLILILKSPSYSCLRAQSFLNTLLGFLWTDFPSAWLLWVAWWYWFSLVWFEKIWWVAAESESGRAVGKEEQLKIDCPRSAKKSYKSTRLQNSAAVEFLVFRSKVQFVSNFQENVLTFLTEGSTSPQTNFSSTANHFRSFDFCTIFPRSWLRKEVSCPRLIALNVPKANGSGCYSVVHPDFLKYATKVFHRSQLSW